MHIIRCVLCVVIFILVLFLFNSTFIPDTAHSTADVDKYILLTVDTKTHQPTHIVLFHKNQHALCKDMTRPKAIDLYRFIFMARFCETCVHVYK